MLFRSEMWLEWSSTAPVKYWSTLTETWLGGSTWTNIGSTVWSYSISTTAFVSGEQYGVKVRGVDKTDYSENVEDGVSKSSGTFYFDNTAPATVVSYPVNGGKYVITDKVNGTATDDANNEFAHEAGMKVTDIALLDVTLNKWWDGGSSTSSFSSANEVWIGTTSWAAPNWEVTIATTIFISGHSYRVKSRGTDNVPGAGANVETPSSINDFDIDFQPPASEITIPEENKYYSSLPEITGTSADDYAGVNGVELTIRDVAAGVYFQQPGWGAETWLQAAATDGVFDTTSEDWKYADTSWQTTGKRYEVKVRAYDVYANTETEHGYGFVIDRSEERRVGKECRSRWSPYH